jgi:hypothetical protein
VSVRSRTLLYLSGRFAAVCGEEKLRPWSAILEKWLRMWRAFRPLPQS